jgi:putative transposase
MLNPLKEKRDRAMAEAERIKDASARRDALDRARRSYLVAVDALLDRNLGSCALADPGAAQVLVDSMKYFDGERYNLFAWSVLPNHAHAVFQLLNRKLDQVMHSWKSYASKEINRLRGVHGNLFQAEYFDVAIRDAKHFDACVK